MKKQRFSLLSLIFAIGFYVFTFAGLSTFVKANQPSWENYVDFVVEVEEGREVVVLQLTDTQILNSDEKRYSGRIGKTQTDLYNGTTFAYNYENIVAEVINEVNPDLIIMTGDQTYGEFDDSGESHKAIIEFMDSFGIPWAPIFGNHEIESNMGADWMSDLYAQSDYCLFNQNTISGNGNYTVGIVQGGELKRVFFMMDSNGTYHASALSANNGQTKTSWGFAADQKAWFTSVGESIKEAAPNAKISFAFHVPFKAAYDALATYGWSDSYDFTNNGPIFIEDESTGDFGFMASKGGDSWDTNYEMYNAMKDLGVDSIYCGHIHSICASVVYDGVRFQFGLKSSLYDSHLTKIGDKYDASHAIGGKPYVGGTVNVLGNDGAIIDAYHVYSDIESDAGNGTISTVGEPTLDGTFKGYEYAELNLTDLAGELTASGESAYYDVEQDSYSVSFNFTPSAFKFDLAISLLSQGTASSGFGITLNESSVNLINSTVNNGKFDYEFIKGKTYEIEIGAVKMYEGGNTYYLFVKINGEVGEKWRYEEASKYALGTKLGVRYTAEESEEESLILSMVSLVANADRVQASGFNGDGTYYTSLKLKPTSTVTETGIDYVVSSYENGEFYYNGKAEGFDLNFATTQASNPWETGEYNTSASKDYLFIVLRGTSNGAPFGTDNQGYIFAFTRTKNGTKTATKCSVFAKYNGTSWDSNKVGDATWFNGDLFDGTTRRLEISAVNNEDNTAVTLRYAVNGKEYFNKVYENTPLSMENTGLRVVDYVDGGTKTGILFQFSGTMALNVDYTNGEELVQSGKLVTDYKSPYPLTVVDGWAHSESSWLVYNDKIDAVDFDIIFTNAGDGPTQIALYMRATGTGTLWDSSQGYIAWIQGTSVEISKTTVKYTDGREVLAKGTVANIFDGTAHNIKYYAVNGEDGKVYGGLSIDGANMITFVDDGDVLTLVGTNFKMVGVNGTSPRYKIGTYDGEVENPDPEPDPEPDPDPAPEDTGIAITNDVMLANPDKLLPAFNYGGAERCTVSNGQISSWVDGNFFYRDEVDSAAFTFTAGAGQSMLFVGLHLNSVCVPWASTGYFAFIQGGNASVYKIDADDLGAWTNGQLGEAVALPVNVFDGAAHELSFAVSGKTLTFVVDGTTIERTFEDAPISITNTEFGMSSNGTGAFLLGEAELVIVERDYEGEFTNIETLIAQGAIRADYNYNGDFHCVKSNGYVEANEYKMSINATITAIDFDIVVTKGRSVYVAMRATRGGAIWEIGGYAVWLDGTTLKFWDLSTGWHDAPDITVNNFTDIFDGEAHNIKMYAFDDEDGYVQIGFSVDGGEWVRYVDTTDVVTLDGHTEVFLMSVNDNSVRFKVGAPEGTTHNYGEEVVLAPTCTEGGHTAIVCQDCLKTVISNEVPALGHSHEAVVTEPTCLDDGYTTYTCVCGDSYVEAGEPATGHNHEETVVPPTCESKGYTLHSCVCGDSYMDTFEDELGHDMTDATCEDPATCRREGCEYTEDALGHDMADATCTDPATCTVCGHTEGEANGHSFGEWEVVKEATTTEVGEKKRECSACGETETEEIPVVEEESEEESEVASEEESESVSEEESEVESEEESEIVSEEESEIVSEEESKDDENKTSVGCLGSISGSLFGVIALCGGAFILRKKNRR